MNTSNDLFHLVKTLSKQEKRYFKLYATFYTNEGGNRYTELFDALDKQKNYDEDKLCKALGHSTPAGALNSMKHKLSRLLLNSLAAYHAGKSLNAELRELLAHIEVLYNRGLYEHCRKLANRARKKALQAEKFSVLLDILDWDYRLLIKNMPDDFDRRLQAHFALAADTIENIRALSAQEEDLARLHAELKRNNQPRSTDDSEPRNLHTLITAGAGAPQPGLKARIVHSQKQALYWWICGNAREARRHFGATVALWESNPALIADQPGPYKRDLSNYLTCCISLKHFGDFAETLRKIRALPALSLDDEISLFQNVGVLELTYYLNIGQPEASLRAAEEIRRGIARFGDKVHPYRMASLYHNCSMAYFLSGQYGRALESINSIANQSRAELRRDLQDFMRIFSLVLHYELEDYELLEARFRSEKRHQSKREKPAPLEQCVLRALKALLKCRDTRERRSAYRVFYKELLAILHHRENTEPPGLIELLFWVESKLNARPIAEVYTQKVCAGGPQSARELFPSLAN